MLEIIVGNAVIKTTIRRRCDCLASSAPFTNIQIYLLTYLLTIRLPFDCNSTTLQPFDDILYDRRHHGLNK